MEKKSYYAIIPADVRYDERLKLLSRMLYGEITALCNEKGFCWAGNRYFADLYKSSIQTISSCINQLKECGYITVSFQYKENTKEVDKRIIQINDIPREENLKGSSKNLEGGIQEILKGGIQENLKDNNTSINNTINNTINIRREKFVPPTLEEVEAYCKERKNKVNAKQFFDYYNEGSWKDGQGKPVKNWKQKMIATWEKNAEKDAAMNKPATKRAEDRGWRLF